MTSQKTTDSTAFHNLGAGFDFFNEWMKAAGSGMPNFVPGGAAASAQTPSWLLPTLDAQELEKRIRDLQAVKFWLEQNAQMVATTIQTLEVQRMTLEALKGMNLSADAIKASMSPAADGVDPDKDERASVVNPMAWWDTLSQQFTHMTQQAVAQAATAAKTAAASKPAKTGPAARSARPASSKTTKRAPQAKPKA